MSLFRRFLYPIVKRSTPCTVINIHIDYDQNALADFTDTHRTYCSRFNYEYRQIQTNLLPGAKPTWSKHVAALEVIDDRDAVMIIDSDAQILPDCPGFDRLLNANSNHDLFLALGHSFRPNAGVIMLRGRSKASVLFLETLLAERESEVPLKDKAVPGGDNGHVINLLRRPKFREKLFLLSPVWNNTTQPTDWDYIRHYTGPMKAHTPIA
ncbi:hypothetical protein [Pararhizobium sp.]